MRDNYTHNNNQQQHHPDPTKPPPPPPPTQQQVTQLPASPTVAATNEVKVRRLDFKKMTSQCVIQAPSFNQFACCAVLFSLYLSLLVFFLSTEEIGYSKVLKEGKR